MASVFVSRWDDAVTGRLPGVLENQFGIAMARRTYKACRGLLTSPRWQRFWDWAFSLGSLLPALLFGVALGNVLRGLPLGPGAAWQGSFFGLLNPFSLLVGLLSLTQLTLHGALFLAVKTEGEVQQRLHGLILKFWSAYIILFVATSSVAALTSKFLFVGLSGNPIFWILVVLLSISLAYIPRALRGQKYAPAFVASCLAIVCIMGLAGLSLYPRMAPSSINLEYSLTIYNACASPHSLRTMLIIMLIGLPFVLGYTFYVYRVFRGKVKIGEAGY